MNLNENFDLQSNEIIGNFQKDNDKFEEIIFIIYPKKIRRKDSPP